MIYIDIISWLSVLACLVIYFRGSEYNFALANVVFCLPIALSAILHGAYPSAVISITFGLIGVYKVWYW